LLHRRRGTIYRCEQIPGIAGRLPQTGFEPGRQQERGLKGVC
jgi:hypothetical protein